MNTRGPQYPIPAKPRASQQCHGTLARAAPWAWFWLRGVRTTYWVICRSCGFLGGFPTSYPPCQWRVACEIWREPHIPCAMASGKCTVAHLELLHGNHFLALHRETWHLVVTDKQMKLFFLPANCLILRRLQFPQLLMNSCDFWVNWWFLMVYL